MPRLTELFGLNRAGKTVVFEGSDVILCGCSGAGGSEVLQVAHVSVDDV